MKKFFKVMFLIIIGMIFFYLLSSFAMADFNISHWSKKSRLFIAFIGFLISLLASLIANDTVKEI